MADGEERPEGSEPESSEPADAEDYPVLQDESESGADPDDEPAPPGPKVKELAPRAQKLGLLTWGVAIFMSWQNASSQGSSGEGSSDPMGTLESIGYLLDALIQLGAPSFLAVWAIVDALRSIQRQEPQLRKAWVGMVLAVLWLLCVGAMLVWLFILRR